MKFSPNIVALALIAFSWYLVDKFGLDSNGWGWCIFGAILIAVRQSDVGEVEHCSGCTCDEEDDSDFDIEIKQTK